MPPATPAPSRALLEALSPLRLRSRPLHPCSKDSRVRSGTTLKISRSVSSASSQRNEMEVNKSEHPRWSQTPAAMTAPYPTKARAPNWQPYKCNSDPRKLDEVYVKFLGRDGPKLLSEETKWLAVTHKSFDHGRRGFNDRLAFLGKRILELQTSLGLLAAAKVSQKLQTPSLDIHGREPFVHPSTENVEVLLGNAKSFFMHHRQLARLAEEYSIPSVMRWQPKDPENLQGSGCDMVYSQAMYAIIGALALEQGGAVANQIARERVIQVLDVRDMIAGPSENSISI